MNIDYDLLAQWIAVGVIVAIAVFWTVKRIRLSAKGKNGCDCGCGGSSSKNCQTSDSACSDCPLVSNCKKPHK